MGWICKWLGAWSHHPNMVHWTLPCSSHFSSNSPAWLPNRQRKYALEHSGERIFMFLVLCGFSIFLFLISQLYDQDVHFNDIPENRNNGFLIWIINLMMFIRSTAPRKNSRALQRSSLKEGATTRTSVANFWVGKMRLKGCCW